MCVHVRAVCVCSESMNDVTDNAKNNFALDTNLGPLSLRISPGKPSRVKMDSNA